MLSQRYGFPEFNNNHAIHPFTLYPLLLMLDSTPSTLDTTSPQFGD